MNKLNHNFKKYFGQNFIKNFDNIIRTLELLNLEKNDTILEIGPGDGRFTEMILPNVENLDIVEIDHELIKFLKKRFRKEVIKQFDCSLNIYSEDILNFDLTKYKDKNYKVFGSLPYNISKKIISKFIQTKYKPNLCVFVIQKEVASSYTAQTPKSTFLSNFAQIYSNINYEFTIEKHNFEPKPKVDGAVIKIQPHKIPKIQRPLKFTKFLKNAFQTPRKKLKNTLGNIYRKINWNKLFQDLDIKENKRAAEVKFKTWKKIFAEFTKMMS